VSREGPGGRDDLRANIIQRLYAQQRSGGLITQLRVHALEPRLDCLRALTFDQNAGSVIGGTESVYNVRTRRTGAFRPFTHRARVRNATQVAVDSDLVHFHGRDAVERLSEKENEATRDSQVEENLVREENTSNRVEALVVSE
jgi:hypothetical protein